MKYTDASIIIASILAFLGHHFSVEHARDPLPHAKSVAGNGLVRNAEGADRVAHLVERGEGGDDGFLLVEGLLHVNVELVRARHGDGAGFGAMTCGPFALCAALV